MKTNRMSKTMRSADCGTENRNLSQQKYAGCLSEEFAPRGVSLDDIRAALAVTSRETTARAKEPPRPDWIEAHKRGVTVPEFIKDAFAVELRDGSMHKGLLGRYENLRRDFYSYKRSNELPGWLKAVPTQDEWNDRQVASGKVKPVRPSAPRTDEVRAYERGLKQVARARQRGVAAAV